MSYLVFDIAIVVILILFAWRGASRGFVLSLCGLLAVVVAFVGASFLANLLAPKVGAGRLARKLAPTKATMTASRPHRESTKPLDAPRQAKRTRIARIAISNTR